VVLISLKAKADLKRQYDAETKAELASLLSNLNGEPSAAQKAIAEQAAHVIARGRQLRSQDRHREADASAKLLVCLLGELGVLPSQSKPRMRS
jgi:hypothetical protein